MRSVRRAPIVVVLSAVALIPARARAQSTASSASSARGTLTWNAPSSCPSADVVDARIAERVDIPFGDVRVHVTEVSEGVRVDMSTDGADRTFVAPTCDDAATAVAVIVALAAHAKLEATSPPPVPAPAAPSVALPTPPREAPAPPPPAPARTLRWSASVATGVDGGSLPRVSPGLVLGAQVRRGRGALAVAVGGFLPETERADGDPPVHTTVTLLDAVVLGCALAPLHRRLDAGACIGAGVGMMHGRTEGIDHPRSNAGLRPEGVLSLRVEWTPPFVRVGGALLRVEAGAIGDPVRRPFEVAGIGDVFRPAAVALRIGAGVDVPFQ